MQALMYQIPVLSRQLSSFLQQVRTGAAMKRTKCLQEFMEFLSQKHAELKDYLNMLEEAKKRDHRKLGKELGLFTIMEEGPGFPFFLPKGMISEKYSD